MKPERETVETTDPPVPADWNAAVVPNLKVHREPTEKVVGQKEVQIHHTDTDGNPVYIDAGGDQIVVPEGETPPEGAEPFYVTGTEDITATVRGEMDGTYIIEETLEGDPIDRSATGYAAIKPFGAEEVKDVAPKELEAAVTALQALAQKIYDSVE